MKVSSQQYIMAGVGAVVIGVASFYGGMQYQKTQDRAGFAQGGFMQRGNGNFPGGNAQDNQGQRLGGAPNQPNGQNMRFGGNGFRSISGEVISFENNTLTIKTPDGGSSLVLIGDSTSITAQTEASTSSLTAGTTVTVMGTTDTSGSITAQNINIGENTPRELD